MLPNNYNLQKRWKKNLICQGDSGLTDRKSELELGESCNWLVYEFGSTGIVISVLRPINMNMLRFIGKRLNNSKNKAQDGIWLNMNIRKRTIYTNRLNKAFTSKIMFQLLLLWLIVSLILWSDSMKPICGHMAIITWLLLKRKEYEILLDIDTGIRTICTRRLKKGFNPEYPEGCPNQLTLRSLWS